MDGYDVSALSPHYICAMRVVHVGMRVKQPLVLLT